MTARTGVLSASSASRASSSSGGSARLAFTASRTSTLSATSAVSSAQYSISTGPAFQRLIGPSNKATSCLRRSHAITATLSGHASELTSDATNSLQLIGAGGYAASVQGAPAAEWYPHGGTHSARPAAHPDPQNNRSPAVAGLPSDGENLASRKPARGRLARSLRELHPLCRNNGGVMGDGLSEVTVRGGHDEIWSLIAHCIRSIWRHASSDSQRARRRSSRSSRISLAPRVCSIA